MHCSLNSKKMPRRIRFTPTLVGMLIDDQRYVPLGCGCLIWTMESGLEAIQSRGGKPFQLEV